MGAITLSSRSRKAWSGLEDTLLRKLISNGKRAMDIAICLERTTRAVRSRSEVLDISWKDLRRPRRRAHFILPKHSGDRVDLSLIEMILSGGRRLD